MTQSQIALLIQRYVGYAALGLFFSRILAGKFFKKSGIAAWFLFLFFAAVAIHIFAYVFFVYKIKGVFDPFYPFTDLCVLCKNVIYPEYYVNFGRLALWIITAFALLPLFFKKAQKYYWLNYLAFFFLAIHILLLK